MVDDIESFLSAPSGESAVEVAVYNALRVLGSENQGPAQLPHLRLACALVQDLQEVKNMRGSFREGIRIVLGLFPRTQTGKDEAQILGGRLIERLREVLESGIKVGKRNTAGVKQKRRKKAL